MRSGAPRVKAGAGHAARASETLRLGIASHGAALAGPGADSRSEPRHKSLAGLNMLMAGLGPAATPVGISANRNTNHLGLHRTAGFP